MIIQLEMSCYIIYPTEPSTDPKPLLADVVDGRGGGAWVGGDGGGVAGGGIAEGGVLGWEVPTWWKLILT